MKENFLEFIKNLNSSSFDKIKEFVCKEYKLSDEEYQELSDEDKNTYDTFNSFKQWFKEGINDGTLVENGFLDQTFIDNVANIEIDENIKINSISIDTFTNSMLSNFFIHDNNKRFLSGKDVSSLYHATMKVIEDKFLHLSAIKITNEVYHYSLNSTINKSTEHTILKNPFTSIILRHFLLKGGFIDSEKFQQKAKQKALKEKFSIGDEEDLYEKFQQSPSDELYLNSNYKAFSYVKERKNKLSQGQSPDTLFFNYFIKDTRLASKYDFSHQPNIFKLSDYVINGEFDDDYLSFALNKPIISNVELIPSQNKQKLQELQEQLNNLKNEQEILKLKMQNSEKKFLDKKNNSFFQKIANNIKIFLNI